jgi:hypothetical protein
MRGIELTKRARDMPDERKIPEEWLQSTLTHPESTQTDEEGNIHLFKAIPQYGSRVLHVVRNPTTDPSRVVTLFFDRRAGRR